MVPTRQLLQKVPHSVVAVAGRCETSVLLVVVWAGPASQVHAHRASVVMEAVAGPCRRKAVSEKGKRRRGVMLLVKLACWPSKAVHVRRRCLRQSHL